jgi:hypothetical protein
MRLAYLLAPVVAATLAACTSMTPQERRAVDEAQCRDYGFTPGTDGFASCLQRIDLDRRQATRSQMDRLAAQDPFMRGPVVIYQPVPVPVPQR